jgi:hypothetical protein
MKRPVPAVPHTAALLWALLAVYASSAAAATYDGFIPMVTDSSAVFAMPTIARPLYTTAMLEPTFGTVLTRVTGDPGQPIGKLGSTWGTVSRQEYSKIQPWNSTMTLIAIDNSGVGLDPVYLDGEGYQPAYGPCPNYDRWDARWHPKLVHSREEINVNRAGTELMWFDVVNCVKTRSWPLPIVADYGIGSGEGNVSNSGRFVAIANQHQMVVVDMDPPASVAPPYPYRRIGPVYTFAACSLDVARPDSGFIGNVSISPTGKYIDVKYGGLALAGMPVCDTLCDQHRIFEVDSGLVIRPHNMADNSVRCGSFQARPNGWVFPLKHADMAVDPDDLNEEVLIGGRACPGSKIGHVVKVRLKDGLVTSLTNPVNEPAYSHGSARNLMRPGWFYVTYSRDPVYQGYRFYGEVVAVRTDGSGQVQRFGHYHSTAATFDAEAHAVPSPDGRRVMFASDWADHASGTSSPGVRAYIFDAREGATLDAPGPEPPRRLELVSLSPNPTPRGLHVRFRIPAPRPAALELYDLAGRRLYVADAGTLGVGEHVLDLDPDNRLEPGIYFVTLTDGHERLTARAVVLH